MNIATILFTYNRSRHTKAVLDALEKNTVMPQKLFIFQDGMKNSTNEKDWRAVSTVITSVSWCDTQVVISEKNKGLAASIITGINNVLETFDAVIVLEDDCVPHPQFMEYMVKALEKYQNCNEVYQIGATSEPAEPMDNGTDAYFLGRTNSCGWGTWKNRWEKFNCDYTVVGKIKADVELNDWLQLWGADLESHVVGNVYGKTDSWAAFWALTVIMNKGYCMAPYESFINNIGFDGSGTHCGVGENALKLRPHEKLTEIELPDKVEFIEGYRKSFAYYYPWVSPEIKNGYYKNAAYDLLDLQRSPKSIKDLLKHEKISHIMIWGKGRLCDYLISDIAEEIVIDAIIEAIPKEEKYKGIPIISWKDIPQDIPLVVVIPGYDMNRIENMIDDAKLMNKVIPIDKLIKRANM